MSTEPGIDRERFSAFELSGWDRNIAGYDRAFGSVARQSVATMLADAAVARGQRILDVCCGPGILAAGGLALGAHAVGIDFAPNAVDLARALVPGGEFLQGDAQALPFPDASFDAVLCGFGLMHLPDPDVALREMLRVLRPRGRAAVSAWDERGVAFRLVYEAIGADGSAGAPLPRGPDPFQFGTPERMRSGLAAAGFADAAAGSVALEWRVADVDRYLDAIFTGTVRAGAALSAQPPDALAAVRAHIAAYLERYRTPDGDLSVPMPAIVGCGSCPG